MEIGGANYTGRVRANQGWQCKHGNRQVVGSGWGGGAGRDKAIFRTPHQSEHDTRKYQLKEPARLLVRLVCAKLYDE